MRRDVRAFVAATAALVAISGCTASTQEIDDPLSTPTNQIRLYGTDGNMLNGVGDLLTEHPNGMVGMKGTTPLSRLSQNFKDRLRSIDPDLIDESYAGETYDAVVISALAAQIARSTEPREIAAQINGVTTRGTECDTPAECLSLIRDGVDIRYRGISLGLGGFTDAGEPSASTYGILRFADNNHLDPAQTQYVPAGDAKQATTKAPPPGRGNGVGPLRIGALLPKTGALASAGPPLFAGALLAIKEINEAGGVLGRDVVWIDGDDGTSAEVALQTVERLIDEGVHVIIGAGASSVTKAVLPTVLEAGVILFSPCNTAAEFSTMDDQGLYFRTAPPDNLQAAALTDVIMRDGVRRLVILAREDAYGTGLMEAVRDNLIRAGVASSDIRTMPYHPDQPDFSNLGTEVKDFGPDGVLIIGFEETAQAIHSMIEAGLQSRPV
ncbi:MAG TPA: ABC transporter substrate-binding protein [Micromonosporaceae bacterium]|nr:ABC transporter substrate-binding protein [Micromonosporaceae bacterium]